MHQSQNPSCSEVRCYRFETMIVWSDLGGYQVKRSSVLHWYLAEDQPHLNERVVKNLPHSENMKNPSQRSCPHHRELFFFLPGVQQHSLVSSCHPLGLVFSQT